MKRIRRASKQQLHGFIQEAVEPDSTIHTDGWEGYVGLEALGYRHEYDFVATSSQSASELLPRVHRVAALLKRWLIGNACGAVSREHLDYYLDEYTFRFNRRRSPSPGKALLPAWRNKPRPLAPPPIQRWYNTCAVGGSANHKIWGSRE